MSLAGEDDDLLAPGEEVDLSNCDREPIHIPGAIQPHGLLFTVAEPDHVVAQVSRNADAVLGQPAEQIVGASVASVLGDELAASVRELASRPMSGDIPTALVHLPGASGVHELSVHRSQGLLVCELESDDGAGPALDFGRVQQELAAAEGVSELSRCAAEHVQRLSGYDRVMVYRFDGDGHGEVIAEVREPHLDSFLGHHYPATDIPKQARALYLRQAIRIIVDVDYEPAPVWPGDNPLNGAPLDLGVSRLRSVSPIHLEYLRNMGVTATLVISLISDGQLWGLIACHHYSPRFVPHRLRRSCRAVGDLLTAEIVRQEQSSLERERADRQVLHRQLMRLVDNATSPADGLRAGANLLLELCAADGVSVRLLGEQVTIGDVPRPQQEAEIVQRMPDDGTPLQIDRLTRELPFVSHHTDLCGVLAVPMDHDRYIVWYRDEWIHNLTWGGDPTDSTRPDLTSTSLKDLSPRRSFEAWNQAVIGRARPWRESEIEAAVMLAEALGEHR